MKVIAYTNQEFGPLGDRKKTTIFYEDGTSKIIYPNDKRTKEETRELMFYSIKRFNEFHSKKKRKWATKKQISLTMEKGFN